MCGDAQWQPTLFLYATKIAGEVSRMVAIAQHLGYATTYSNNECAVLQLCAVTIRDPFGCAAQLGLA
jgi:hypothetical protein